MRYSAVTIFGFRRANSFENSLAKAPHLFLERTSHDRNVHMDTAGARGLCIAFDFQRRESIAHDQRSF
jgi:hypothetical protein